MLDVTPEIFRVVRGVAFVKHEEVRLAVALQHGVAVDEFENFTGTLGRDLDALGPEDARNRHGEGGLPGSRPGIEDVVA